MKRLGVPAVLLAALLTGCAAAAPTPVLGEEDGHLGRLETVSPYADVPAVTRLDPQLRAALHAATAAAAADGVELRVSSGWRSAALQEQLLATAIAEDGEEQARRLVHSAEVSRHVTGDAVDVLPTDAADWLIRRGARFGLCQTYANEMWHFELATEPGGGCPAPLADPSGVTHRGWAPPVSSAPTWPHR